MLAGFLFITKVGKNYRWLAYCLILMPQGKTYVFLIKDFVGSGEVVGQKDHYFKNIL